MWNERLPIWKSTLGPPSLGPRRAVPHEHAASAAPSARRESIATRYHQRAISTTRERGFTVYDPSITAAAPASQKFAAGSAQEAVSISRTQLFPAGAGGTAKMPDPQYRFESRRKSRSPTALPCR